MEALSRQQPGGQQPAPFVLGQLGGQEPQEEKFDFWGVLNRRKWLVFLGLVTGLGLAALYYAQTDTVYRSHANIKIEPKDPMAFRISQTDIMQPGADLFNYRHDRFIAQHNIVESCLETYQLYNLKSFETVVREEVVQNVLNDLLIEPDKEEPFIYLLQFDSCEKEDSKTILNNIIRTYKDNLDKQYKDASQGYVDVLKEVKKEFQADYSQLDSELKTLMEANDQPAITPGHLNIHQSKVGTLGDSIALATAEYNSLNATRLRSEAALAQGADACRDLVWQLNQEGVIKTTSTESEEIRTRNTDSIKQSIQNLELQRLTLSRQLGPGAPQMEAIADQIAGWTNYLAEIEAEVIPSTGSIKDEEVLRLIVGSNSTQIALLSQKIQSETEQFDMHMTEAKRLNMLQQQIAQVEHDRAYVEGLLNEANKKIVEIDPSEKMDIKDTNEGFNFQVLMDATKGEVIWPLLHIVLAIGGLLGILAGFGLGCLVELADKTFHNPDEIMKQLNLPLIGHIPVISQSKRYVVENSDIDPIVCTYHRPKSQVSEAFRAVRTAMYFNTQGQAHQVIQVTSPTPGDGKSTLASNLAVSIAQSGKRVLLVDADMRRPRQHVTFGVTSNDGFATVLSGMSSWRDVIFNCDEIEGLSIMPCGAKPQNPAELSTSPQVKELIDEMREEFDFVIIDTPPLLAVTDPCPIAARVDGVILTLRIKKNVRVSAERATDILRNLGAHVFGLVVNGVGAQTGYGSQYTYGAYRAGYAYNGYGYGYGYGYGSQGKYYDDDQKGRRRPTPTPTQNIEAQPTAPGQETPG